MKRLYCILSVLLLLLVVVATVSAENKGNILSQKKELEKIKRDVEQSQRKLDSLKQKQMSVQKQVSEYDQKLSSDRKVINRLSGQLRKLTSDIGGTEGQLSDKRVSFDRAQRRYLGNVRQFYYSMRKSDELFSYNPNVELQRHREVLYLTAVADLESGNVKEASREVGQTESALDALTGKQAEVTNLKKKKETSYSLVKTRKNKQEKDLDRLRRRSMDEAERIATLRLAAQEMERIIARLEEERRQAELAQKVDRGPSVFAGLKGQLRPPFRGRIVVPYGDLVDPVTNLKSFSPGITIKGKSTDGVYLVASGKVAYTGDLRGYGQFVIINHDNQYYSTYAGLGRILVTQGQHLPAGSKLATAGSSGEIKFELRKGREPLDPVTWIKFESL